MDTLLEVGQVAPSFTLMSGTGQSVSLSQFRGKKVVVYFYPKDNTSGCTTEACDFKTHHGSIEASNALVVGISRDSVKSHAGFASKFQLPFILLSDVEEVVVRQYGVLRTKKMYGKEYLGIVRSTFIIDEKGIITHIFDNVKVPGHVESVLKALNELE